jgi:hypothetical protein
MNGRRRWFALGLAASLAAASGCAIGKTPYAHDPLIRDNRAVWGSRQALPPASNPEPIAPPPPNAPLIGDERVVTSVR